MSPPTSPRQRRTERRILTYRPRTTPVTGLLPGHLSNRQNQRRRPVQTMMINDLPGPAVTVPCGGASWRNEQLLLRRGAVAPGAQGSGTCGHPGVFRCNFCLPHSRLCGALLPRETVGEPPVTLIARQSPMLIGKFSQKRQPPCTAGRYFMGTGLRTSIPGALLIADSLNNRIRVVTGGP